MTAAGRKARTGARWGRTRGLGAPPGQAYTRAMPIEGFLLLLDDIEVSLGVPSSITNGDWHHVRAIRAKARRIARQLLRSCGARAGEGWSILLSMDGTATVTRLW